MSGTIVCVPHLLDRTRKKKRKEEAGLSYIMGTCRTGQVENLSFISLSPLSGQTGDKRYDSGKYCSPSPSPPLLAGGAFCCQRWSLRFLLRLPPGIPLSLAGHTQTPSYEQQPAAYGAHARISLYLFFHHLLISSLHQT